MRRKPLAAVKLAVAAVNETDFSGFAAEDDSLKAFAGKYYEWLRVTNYSEVTVECKRKALNKFFIFCGERNAEKIQDVTPGLIERYQQHIFYYRNPKTNKPRAAVTQRHMLTAVHTFFYWLVKKRFLSTNPASVMDMPKLPFQLPKNILSIKEVEQVLERIDLGRPKGLRDRALLEVFYSTGLRRKEMRTLKTRDLDRDAGVLIVRQGKGMKDRVIPIGDRAVHWVQRYLEEARPSFASQQTDPEFLFLTVNGGQLALSYLTELTRRIIKASEIEKTGACHLFRHTFATHLLENDTDIRFIQAMLGHKNLESTKLYTHIAIKKLKEVHTAKHPAAKLPENQLPKPRQRKDK